MKPLDRETLRAIVAKDPGFAVDTIEALQFVFHELHVDVLVELCWTEDEARARSRGDELEASLSYARLSEDPSAEHYVATLEKLKSLVTEQSGGTENA